jgi:C4-dicarboxylate-specific signal transduction histidine kinase
MVSRRKSEEGLGMKSEQDALKEAMIKMSKLALLGDMAPGIAHEVNNPIAVIIGRAEILLSQIQEGPVDPAMLTKSISKINEMGGGVKFKCSDVKLIINNDGKYI